MDKYIKDKLNSFGFSLTQQMILVDVIKHIAQQISNSGGIDTSNLVTKDDLHNSVHGLELDINTVRDTAVEANRIANNNIDEINNINNNIIPNFYTKTEVDNKIDDRIQQIVGADTQALDTLEEIAIRLEEYSDTIEAINGVLAGKIDNTLFTTTISNINNDIVNINDRITALAAKIK